MAPTALSQPVTLADLHACKAAGRKFAMLTAYDYPTGVAAEAAGVPTLLVGDSLGNVVLGQETTREVPLELMLVLGAAVRRGAPNAYLVGDIPFETMQGGDDAIAAASRRFLDEVGCQAVKLEVEPQHAETIRRLRAADVPAIAHLGLRPQSVTTPDGHRVQARDAAQIAELVELAVAMAAAGATMLLLEAVPPEASAAVVEAVKIPVIGCGAGPACDGYVVVTHDLLGLSSGKPPRFVPVYEQLAERMTAAMTQWRAAIESGGYPKPEHNYRLRP